MGSQNNAGLDSIADQIRDCSIRLTSGSFVSKRRVVLTQAEIDTRVENRGEFPTSDLPSNLQGALANALRLSKESHS